MSFERFLDFIRDGEPVSAGTTNRPIQQVDQNVRYLWELIQAAELGSTVYARQQTVLSTLKVGQPVYFNPSTDQFEPAFAVVVTDTETGYLLVAESSQVWGIVASKSNATLADILLFGLAAIDITEAVGDEEITAGIWYLSGSGIGGLTKQQPPVSVPVLKSDGNGNVFVNPKLVDFVENHRHYTFNLSMQPAGTVSPPAVSFPHTLATVDADVVGWLPADHVSFDGKAPVGAKFGYNLIADPSLGNLWPPIPIQSASLEMQRPSIWDSNTERKWHASQLTSDTVVMDRNGIWWMTDCYDSVPWPTDLNTAGMDSTSASSDECDASNRTPSLRLYFTRVNFATDNTLVRSLISLDSRLVITCEGTDDAASSGDLAINLNLEFMAGDTDMTGYSVFKSFDATTGKFNAGPVAEGVYATSENVLLTSDFQTEVDGETIHHGLVGVGVSSQATQELPSKLVRLDGATEESFPVLYIGMPNDSQSRYVVQFEVPADAPTDIGFQLRLRLIGRAAGTLPQLTVEYFKTARPDGLTSPVLVTEAYSLLTVVTVATLSAANQAVEAVSSSIDVDAGDIVYVRVTRTPAAVSDAYAAELGVMQQVGVIVSS